MDALTADLTEENAAGTGESLVKLASPCGWHVGDLITIGRFSERRIIIDVTQTVITVMAESGWWNAYEIEGVLPINFVGTTTLRYEYQDRWQAVRDFAAGKFTTFFNQV